jgi:hypothetical protein
MKSGTVIVNDPELYRALHPERRKLVITYVGTISGNGKRESFPKVKRESAMNIVRRRQVKNIKSARWGSIDLDLSAVRNTEGRAKTFLEKLPSVREIMKGFGRMRHLSK